MLLSWMQPEILCIIRSSSSFTMNFRQNNIDLVMNSDSDIVTWGEGDLTKKCTPFPDQRKTGWTVVDCGKGGRAFAKK